jgi:hypothetical protein
MASRQEGIRQEEVLDQQEKFLNEQLILRRKSLAQTKARKRRLIVFRMLSLFSGVVLFLFGFIVMFFTDLEDGNFNNILVFTLSELAAIPLLRYSWQVFRKLDLDQEISDRAELITQTLDNLELLNDERLKLIRSSGRENKTIVRPGMIQDDIVDAKALMAEPAFKSCPKCAENVRAEANVCIYCGHKFGS